MEAVRVRAEDWLYGSSIIQCNFQQWSHNKFYECCSGVNTVGILNRLMEAESECWGRSEGSSPTGTKSKHKEMPNERKEVTLIMQMQHEATMSHPKEKQSDEPVYSFSKAFTCQSFIIQLWDLGQVSKPHWVIPCGPSPEQLSASQHSIWASPSVQTCIKPPV